MKIYLRANERIFINGAVLRVDRKVSLELLNDTTFLLENHVLQKEDADTPLKQLYFVVQMMLMDPSSKEQAMGVFRDMVREMLDKITNEELLHGIKTVDLEVSSGNPFPALKVIRALFAVEEEILSEPAKANPAIMKEAAPVLAAAGMKG